MDTVNRLFFIALSCVVAIFYLNVPIYLDSIGLHFQTFIIQIFSFSLISIYCLMNIRQIRISYSFVFIYFLLMLISFTYYVFLPDDYAKQGWRNFRLMFVFLILFMLVFSIFFNKKYNVLKIFVYTTLIAIVSNYLDFFGQGQFFIKLDNFSARAAGFYVDPNKAAGGILMSMCLSIFVVPMRWRVLYVYLCLSGVLLTVSRGGIIVWMLICTYWFITGTIGRKATLISLSALVFFSGYIILFFDTVSGYVDMSLLQDRLAFLSGNQVSKSIEGDSRVGLAEAAFRLFMEHPIWGNGPLSLLRAGFGQLSHNEYLALLSDYGVVGFILYCCLIYTVFAGRKLFSGVLLFVLLWGFFSHDMLESYVSIIAFSIICIYPVTRKYESFKGVLRV